MKKIFFTFIFLFVATFCFANTEESIITSDSFRTVFLALQDEIIVTLQVSNSEIFVASAIEELSNASQSQRSADLEKNKQKEQIKKNKLKNKPYQFACFGVDALVNIGSLDSIFTSDSSNIFFGGFYQPIIVYDLWTFKGAIGLDFLKNQFSEPFTSLYFVASLGIAPLHNDYLYLGIYGTYCFETINCYTYNSFGGSLTFGFKCSDSVFFLMNLDATYRLTEKQPDVDDDYVYMNSLLGSWRVSPSASIAFKVNL